MTDSSGKFVLTGVLAGPVELHSQGPGVNARLTISTTAGQTLTITVNVTGGQEDGHLTFSSLRVGANIQVHGTTQADMSVLDKTIQLQDSTGDDGGEAELKGKIQSINTGAGTLVVGGKTVATDSKTRIRRDDKTLTLMDLKVNDSVDIQGTTRTDGTVLATEINVEGGD